MKGFLAAVLLLLAILAALSLFPGEVSPATAFGLFASLSGALVIGVSVMVLSRGGSRQG